jgi:hypothetical protein
VTRVYRTDLSTLRPAERRPNGTIVVDAFLSKCGVFQYVQPDGSIRRELRLPEDVHDVESLRSFEGVPVTNNHPPGMIDAGNARQYSVGAVLGSPVPDADHIRGRLAVHDADAIRDMESGKTQVSNGYSCDCLEQPGVHPLYGAYDAVQKNIRGNHVAIVDRARAGVTASARMDADRTNGMMLSHAEQSSLGQYGTKIAVDVNPASCKSYAMSELPTARVEVVVKSDAGEPSASRKIDPDDLASRNARGETEAKPRKKLPPGESYEDDDEDEDEDHTDASRKMSSGDDDEDGDEDDRDDRSGDVVRGAIPAVKPDAYDSSYGGTFGTKDEELTSEARDKIRASNFAAPDSGKLPIHDPAHVRAAMSRFGQTDFKSADEKHGAFNRIKKKAKQFGIGTEGFEKAHAGKLDRADSAQKDSTMTTDIKALQEKADKRKAKLEKAKTRIDALQAEVAEKDALIENLRRDGAKKDSVEAQTPRADEAEIQARADAKLSLLDQARQTGAQVNASMPDVEIMRAAIKHVDGEDVPEAKQKDASYVQALFDGALKRAKKDAAADERGSAALAATRVAVETARTNTHLDATTDEDEAKARLRAANRELINQPGKHRVAGR